MTKNFQCDVCKRIIETKYDEPYPKDWFLIRLFSKPARNMKGQQSKGYHICPKCKEKIFGE
jgi:hypothetical protein